MNPQAPTATVQTPADQYAQLKSAVLGAQVNTPQGASPLGSFPELDKLYSSRPQVAKVDLASAGPQYNTGVKVSADNAAAKAAYEAAQNDPSKYKQILKPDGGYAFYDAQGNEINASQYAAATNSDITKVLGNSYNPVDKAFVQDYNQLQQYIQDKQAAKNDPQARSRAQTVETQVRKLYNIDLHQQNPNEVIEAFMKAYPTVFGNNSTVQNPIQPGFGSAAGKQGTQALLPTPYQNKQANKVNASGTSSLSGGAP